MLRLKNIFKNYFVGDDVVNALKGVSVNFRKSEFVAILGHSGCGKTTLLNIVGGLDKYTAGDLIINGVSTKKYTDRDWDAYRNNSIGFVFQSYNLIPHQTVLENVELALTLSGIGVEERKKRATEALIKVGLKDQIKKRPNQLSGGQMQRVAIARALVNNPEIILADEPTGALDSQTSVQIMEILKEVSKDRLVIMVTHNPEIAKEYATRIINLKDGLIIGDTNPYEGVENVVMPEPSKKEKKKIKKGHSMSFLTAIKLSFKNLFTKKARTILTSFAGSIGIIGIALIMSLSSGFNAYIAKVQEDTLSNYPLTIQKSSVDLTSVITGTAGSTANSKTEFPSNEQITVNGNLNNIFSSVMGNVYENDLKSFKTYLDGELNQEENRDKVSAVQYIYNLKLSWYREREEGKHEEINDFDMSNIMDLGSAMTSGLFSEMIDNEELIRSQYDVLWGDLPSGSSQEKAGQAILVLDSYNGINDVNLFNLGFEVKELEYSILKTYMMTNPNADKILEDNGYSKDSKNKAYTFEDFKNLEFKVLTNSEYYKLDSNYKDGEYYENYETKKSMTWGGKTIRMDRLMRKALVYQEIPSFMDPNLLEIENSKLGSAQTVKIVGIVRKKKGVSSGALSGTVCYTKELTEELISLSKQSDVYKAQYNSQDKCLIKGADEGITLTPETYKNKLEEIGVCDLDDPSSIAIYPTSFENKDSVVNIIEKYNKGKEYEEQIKYSDYLGTMMSSITVIINAISYVLIAFVSISLVVSSIMIGIITYISVLERTKEIGVLRSLGASKKDISRVFNAETLIIGFVSGIMGILITIILNFPITAIIQSLADITAVASLPLIGGIGLVLISMLLTLVAGLLPSRMAAKKDPVIALRTE